MPKLIGALPPSFLRIPQVKDARVDLSLDMDDDKIAAFLQNEEFMAELRWNQEFIAALDSEQGHKTKCHDDDAAFKERLKTMGKCKFKVILVMKNVTILPFTTVTASKNYIFLKIRKHQRHHTML